MYRSLAPWFLCGFAVMLISGASLFVAFATDAYGNLYFRIKIAALVLAGASALCFHFVTQAGAATWDDAAKPAALVRRRLRIDRPPGGSDPLGSHDSLHDVLMAITMVIRKHWTRSTSRTGLGVIILS